MRGARVLCLIGFALALARPAHAQEALTAKQTFERGQSEFMMGNYDLAIRDFESAYASSRKVALLWNIAKAHRKQYEVDHDVTHLRKAKLVCQTFGDATESEQERSEALIEVKAISAQLDSIDHPPIVTTPPAAPSTPAAIVAPAPAPIADPYTHIYQRGWFWGVVAAAVVVVGAGVAVALASGPRDATAPMVNSGIFDAKF